MCTGMGQSSLKAAATAICYSDVAVLRGSDDLAVLSLVYVTQHRKLSMFSSHLSPGVHLWYDFSAHTFQIARYVQCNSEILF